MAVQQWLGELFEDFLSVATQLGDAAKSFEFGKFKCILQNLGMKDDEIADLWNALDFDLSLYNYKDGDSELSLRYGVLLDGKFLPHNFLLYRLVSLLHPTILLSVRIETINHKGNVVQGRWEYAGGGKKKILKLQFFPQTKKKRVRVRSRRQRSFPREWV